MALVTRSVEPGDFAQWLTLWDGYNAFYGREGRTALPRAVTDETWRRFLDPAVPVHALVALRDGQLIGMAHYLYHLSTSASDRTCYMQDLFTTQTARGQGGGKALIEAVYAAAKAEGVTRVYWHTHETNATARRVYEAVAERSGFIVYRKTI
ncbi:GNAT family N-acetyltransferase [Asticcacaulis solisilvae]|uniref:GNAT family N-acetyltransferase n=1 Tax=Asticcacaulis solisilvae TaxID=1217274 RepID=UPI003FD6D154